MIELDQSRFPDGHGIYFDEIRMWLPDSIKDWPRVRRVKSKRVLGLMRIDNECYWCGHWGKWYGQNSLEVHHIIGGTKGRSDEFCNLFPVHHTCHEHIQGSVAVQRDVLRKLWIANPPHTDWVRLTLLRGSWWLFDGIGDTK